MIAIDSTSGNTSRTGNNNTHTFTNINNAAGTLFVVGFSVNSDSITGSSVTYGGVAMTLAKKQIGNSEYAHLYYLISPPTGNNTLVITLSGFSLIDYAWASYTGNATSNVIDNTYSTTVGSGGGSTITETITPSVADCWMVAFSGLQRLSTASTNSTRRGGNNVSGGQLFDSNGALTSGAAFSMVQSNSSPSTGVAFTFKPEGGAATYIPKIMMS